MNESYYIPVQTILNFYATHYLSKNDNHNESSVPKLFKPKSFFHNSQNLPFHIGISSTSGLQQLIISSSEIPAIFTALNLTFNPSSTPIPPPPTENFHSLKTVQILSLDSYKAIRKQINIFNAPINSYNLSINYHSVFKDAELALQDPQSIFISVDIESWERNHDIITEIGWSVYPSSGNKGPRTQVEQTIQTTHCIIKENKNYFNGRFVEDNKFNFLFGKSVECVERDCLQLFSDQLDKFVQNGSKVYLIGHDIAADLKYLNQMGLVLPSLIKTIDTQILDLARVNATRGKLGLKKLLLEFEIPYRNLHNAGNDAHYTMLVLLRLLSVPLPPLPPNPFVPN
ncbi:hypothetical protein BKA69DRAFT_1065197 [Paraphysoderma sedebokerense]|nr:hypothetical protein BKA69DRAFT_1065063 [Paraphysoderma sedebokerense]KAI9142882.1 hypothetical protein BKA69DRAFT_1065197 [Paraphysoderma sedebokerense]